MDRGEVVLIHGSTNNFRDVAVRFDVNERPAATKSLEVTDQLTP